jgi:ArsR family transcriptional regulator
MKQKASFFAALADPFRLRCLALISENREVCVCQLTHALGAPQPKVSKHLAILRAAKLIEQRRAAQWVVYRLAALPAWAETVLQGAFAGVADEMVHQADLQRLVSAPEGPPAQKHQFATTKEAGSWQQ